ncbi:aldo/keto reductase [Parasphingorhabdus pacifica]
MAQIPTVTLNDGVALPRVGFGVFQVSPEEATEAVSTALDAGYRTFDTASVYGNEEGVGKAIVSSEVARSDIFLITKVWNDDQGYDETLRACEASLERLGVEYVDQYLIHWPRPKLDRYVDTWKALVRLVSDGRVRSIGVSNFAPENIRRLVDETGVVPAVNQVELHPGFPQTELRSFHEGLGITTQAWSPLGRGQGFLGHPVVGAIARAHDRTPAQVALRWHVQLGVVALPKSVTPERIRSNIGIFDFELTEPEMAQLTDIGTDFRVGPDPALFFDMS